VTLTFRKWKPSLLAPVVPLPIKADRLVGKDAGQRAGVLIVPLTAPRLPGFAPMTGSISSGVAGRNTVKPSAPSFASSSSSLPRRITRNGLPSPM
jgi:hypothetical protein